MIEISFIECWAFITVAWLIVRAAALIINRKISLAREAKLLLVYVCLIVLARIVYFPLYHTPGTFFGTLKLDFSPESAPLINLVPFTFFTERYYGWQLNIIGNTAMFIPVGIVWPLCFKKLDRIWKTVLAGAGLSLFIEISQLPMYSRTSDVDDLILNTLGATIGALIYFTVKRRRNRSERHTPDRQES